VCTDVYIYIYIYARVRNTRTHIAVATAAVRGENAKVFAELGARRRGKVSFNDFDMGGRHVPPCNLHYSRDVSAPAKHCAVEPAGEIAISPNRYLDR